MGKNFTQVENLVPLKDTLANIQARTRIEGVTYYATDTKKNYVDNGTDLVEIGSSGVGSSSIWESFNADKDKVTNWTNTGTGVFIFDGASPVNGTSSYKFITTAQNDEVKRLFTPVFRNKGKENSLSLQYKMDVLGIEVQIYDTATLTIIEQVPLEVSVSSKTLNLPFILKDTSTTIEVRFINTHLTNTPVLFFDDGELSDNPFVYKNLLDKQIIWYDKYAGMGATNIMIPYYITTKENSGSAILTVDNSSINGFSITATKDCTVTIAHVQDMGVTVPMGISLNSTALSAGIHTAANDAFRISEISNNTALPKPVTATVHMKKWDILRPHLSGTPTNDDPRAMIYITAQSESEHVVTPAKSNMSDWVNTGSVNITATTTNPTKGATSVDNMFCRRVGDSLECRIEYKQIGSGTAGSGDYLFNIPTTFEGSNILIDTAKVTPYSVLEGGNSYQMSNKVGSCSFTEAGVNNYYGDVIVYNQNSVRLGLRGGGNGAVSITGVLGSAWGPLSGTSSGCFATFKVPIQGWSSDATFLAAIPTKRIAYLKDVKASGTNGGTFLSGAWQTRVLNTLTGDRSFISLSLDKFTLQKGKYKINASATALAVNGHQAVLYDTTDAIDKIVGSTEKASPASNTSGNSRVSGEVTIAAPHTYEIRHKCVTTKATNGFGNAEFLNSEVYTQVIIEKIK